MKVRELIQRLLPEDMEKEIKANGKQAVGVICTESVIDIIAPMKTPQEPKQYIGRMIGEQE